MDERHISERPPLGLVPKYIRDSQRFVEVKEAIMRYVSEGFKVPLEWIEEYNNFVKKG